MLPYFWYLLKVIICSGILLGYYWLFLRNKIFHQYNRFYLLMAMGLSLLLPLLKINFWQQHTETNGAILVLRAVSVGDEYMNSVAITAQKSFWNFQNLYPLFYWLVSLVFVFILLRTLYIIRTLLKHYPVKQVEEVTFVNTNDDSTPFSFFKYIFWNSSIDMDTVTGRQIFKHEVAHIQEKHTYDKLFVNISLIFFWCNPFFWLYRKELNMIHEFIADKKAVEDSDTAAFAAMILQSAYPRHCFELTNNFFYSPIKRRLLMLTKIDNPRIGYFVRVMVLPLAILVFAAFTFKAKTNNSLYHGKKITVVIDAGHGGEKDLGARAADGTAEKDIALALAKKVKELNKNADIEIILTRDEDIYMTPMQKVDFAKTNNADLVISFHVDGTPKPTEKSGVHFFVSKDQYANASQSKILASALISEFNNSNSLAASTSPQQREVGVWILQANECPAVIIEAGYMTNQKDVNYLKTSTAKETIAKNVLMGIEKYLANKATFQNTQLNTDTIPQKSTSSTTPITINGKKIKNVSLLKEGIYLVEYEDGTSYKMTKVDADKAGIKVSGTGSQVITTTPSDISNQPLYVINGEVKETGFKGGAIKTDDIASVNILKGEQAISKYGTKGINGVIEILLKKERIVVSESTNPELMSDSIIYVYNFTYTGKLNWKINNIDIPNKALYLLNSKETAEEIVAKIANKDVADITVLRGEEATKSYGSKALNGVVIINTKPGYEIRTWKADTLKFYRTAKISPVNKKMLVIVNDNFYYDKTLQEVADELGITQFETILFLTSEKAVKTYGEKAKDGAMLVTLKK